LKEAGFRDGENVAIAYDVPAKLEALADDVVE
jgi:hypothetical protein